MRLFGSISIILLAVCMALTTGCATEKDDNFRVVEYSYVIQQNTDAGPRFAFYAYAFSYVRGPITMLEAAAGQTLTGSMVNDDLFETEVVFSDLSTATDTYHLTVTNERNQRHQSIVKQNIPREKVLGEIVVTGIDYDGAQVTLSIANVSNANYYGFFAIPEVEIGDQKEFVRAAAGRPLLQPAVSGYYDSDTGREQQTSEQFVNQQFSSHRYRSNVKIVPVAAYESPDGDLLVVESEHTIIIEWDQSLDQTKENQN